VIVEPIFANTAKQNGLRRLSLRSQTKVQGQSWLYCLVHNIDKRETHGKLVKMAKKRRNKLNLACGRRLPGISLVHKILPA
jgi:hypothetical protein